MNHIITVRVYGLLFDDRKRLLVSDEYIRGSFYTKLPGGGLEFGEGTKECLLREFKEETGLNVSISKHIYTTDFFQQSAFRKDQQILSIYYLVDCQDLSQLKTSSVPFDLPTNITSDPEASGESFRWVEWDNLSNDVMDLPIDRHVVTLIKKIK